MIFRYRHQSSPNCQQEKLGLQAKESRRYMLRRSGTCRAPDGREIEFTELAAAQGLIVHCPFQWQIPGYRPPDTT